jgi:type II secretory pathway component GspD/PulD (secretin)
MEEMLTIVFIQNERFFFAVLIFSIITVAQSNFSVTIDTNSPILTDQSNIRLKSPITLWAKDANLSEVLKVLAERSGMNFVAGEGVNKGKITIILNATPLNEAINLLVRAAGLSYEIIGNSVLIAERGKLSKEVGQSGYVIKLKYLKAEEVANMLSNLTTNIKVDKSGNRLICFTSPRVINEIEKIIKSVDKPHILVMLETRIIEVSMDKLDKYGIDWSALSPIVSGVNYPVSPLKEGIDPDKWTKAPLEFKLTLNMLLSNGDARILMDSKLTTTNNRQAFLHIGEVIPYTIQTYNTNSSGGSNEQIQKEHVGVKISMIPHVNEEEQITLSIEPEISSISMWVGKGSDLPLIRIRKTKTTVRVENNQTIFLAGLISEEESVAIKKLPVLGDIPLIGLIFQHKKNTIRKSNLIIEITPRIFYNTKDLSISSDIEILENKAIDIKPDSPFKDVESNVK